MVFGLSTVARELGVTRQTVYRYFPGTDALLEATILEGAEPFLNRIEAHLATMKAEPAEVVVEGIAFTIEQLAKDPFMSLAMSDERVGFFARGFTSPYVRTLGMAYIDRWPVDWTAAGFDDRRLADLLELSVRLIQTFSVEPGDPPRRGKRLRSFLTMWLAPSIRAIGEASA